MNELRPTVLQIALEHGVTNPPGKSNLHGEDHWKSVALVGFNLARWTPKADLEFVFSFAMLHDLMRENDGEDRAHGQRAAELFMALCDKPGLEYFPAYMPVWEDMAYALTYHNIAVHARHHLNISVGVCWDADRLTLPRVGKDPDPRYLTTDAARTTGAALLAHGLCMRHPMPSWTQISEEMHTWRL